MILSPVASYIPYLHILFFAYLFRFFYKKKDAKYRFILLITGIYLGSSIFGLIHYNNPSIEYANLSLIPSLYFFLVFCISVIPFYKFNNNSKKNYVINDKFVKYLSIFLLLISILPLMELIFQTHNLFSLNNTSQYVAELHSDAQTGDIEQKIGISQIGHRFLRFAEIFSDLLPILIFYIYNKYKKITKELIGLLISELCLILNAFISSGRSSFVYLIFYFSFIYLLFIHQFSVETKKRIQRAILFVFLFLISFLSVITVYRFTNTTWFAKNNSEELINWTALYVGEGMLNFNEYVWSVSVYTEGDVSFPYFKKLLGIKTFEKNYERRMYWAPKTGIPENIFYTSYGNFVRDFGPIIAFLIICFLSIVIILVIRKKKKLHLYHLLLISLYFKYIGCGIFFFPYAGYGAGMQLFYSILIVFSLFIIDIFSRYKYDIFYKNNH
jgi:oligosaccharide repeat unit polymerase